MMSPSTTEPGLLYPAWLPGGKASGTRCASAVMAPAGLAASPGSGPVSGQLDQLAMPEVWVSSSAIVIGSHAGGQRGRYAHARLAADHDR